MNEKTVDYNEYNEILGIVSGLIATGVVASEKRQAAVAFFSGVYTDPRKIKTHLSDIIQTLSNGVDTLNPAISPSVKEGVLLPDGQFFPGIEIQQSLSVLQGTVSDLEFSPEQA